MDDKETENQKQPQKECQGISTNVHHLAIPAVKETFSMDWTIRLFQRMKSIYLTKWSNNFENVAAIDFAMEEWSEGLAGISGGQVKEALDYCRANLEWPPSIAEFRRLCDQAGGMPSQPEVINNIIRKEFRHPIDQLIYEKIGSWAFKNADEKELKEKVSVAYPMAVAEYRKNPNFHYGRLAHFIEQQNAPQLEAPDYVAEKKNFQALMQRAKMQIVAKAETTTHPVYEKTSITPRHSNFNQKLYNERREYLTGLDEIAAGTLSHADYYARTRFLSEIEGMKQLNQNPYRQEEGSQKRGTSRPVIFKDWNRD